MQSLTEGHLDVLLRLSLAGASRTICIQCGATVCRPLFFGGGVGVGIFLNSSVDW